MTTVAKIGEVTYRFYRETDIMRAKNLFNHLASTVTQEELEEKMEEEEIEFIYNIREEK